MRLPPSHPLRAQVRAALIRTLYAAGVITRAQRERLLCPPPAGAARP